MTKLLTSTLGAACILIASGVLTYGGGLSGRFIFDDRDSIIVNKTIRQLWPPQWLTDPPAQASVSGRPVVAFSLALNYAINGEDVRGYHVFNLAVHILCAFVLLGIIRRTLRCESIADQFGNSSRAIALVCALLWMLHPLQTECVYYIIQRTESLMGLFYLLTLYCAIRARQSHHRRAWSLAAVIACALGMACKESMVTAPLAVLLWDYSFEGKPIRAWFRIRKSLYIGLAATWGFLAFLMLSGPRSATVGTGLGVGAWQYAQNQCVVLVKYLALTFWPHPLTVDYGEPVSVPAIDVVLGGTVIVALLIAAIVTLKRRPVIGFLGAWCFLILGPTSSLVPIITEAGAERRMYLPLAALVVLVVLAVHRLIERIASQRSVVPLKPSVRSLASGGYAFLVVVSAVVLGWTSSVRSADYRTQVAVWESVIRARPQNPRGQCNLGTELWAKDRIEEACHHFEEAIRLDPDLEEAHLVYGIVLKGMGESDAAMQHFREAVRAAPWYAEAYYELGTAHNSKGELDQAIRNFRSAVSINPRYVNAHIDLGNALRVRKAYDESVEHYRTALQVKPNHALAHLNLGNVFLEMGRIAEGVKSLKDALRAKPNWTAPMNRIAWILATHPDPGVRDPAQAVQYALRAAELTKFQKAYILDTLAAAYANAGQFDEAMRIAGAGLALYSGKTTKRARALQRRLQRYRQKLPYREPVGIQ